MKSWAQGHQPASGRAGREPRLVQGPKGAHRTHLLLEREVRGEFHAQNVTEEKQSLVQTDKTHTKWEELLWLGRCCKSLFLVPEGQ